MWPLMVLSWVPSLPLLNIHIALCLFRDAMLFLIKSSHACTHGVFLHKVPFNTVLYKSKF